MRQNTCCIKRSLRPCQETKYIIGTVCVKTIRSFSMTNIVAVFVFTCIFGVKFFISIIGFKPTNSNVYILLHFFQKVDGILKLVPGLFTCHEMMDLCPGCEESCEVQTIGDG